MFSLGTLFCYNYCVSAQDPAIETTPQAGQTPSTVETVDSPPVERPARREPLQALRNRDFRLYWIGNFISQAGSQMRLVAVGVQLWDLTHSFAALGLLGVVKIVPLLALSLFGGVIADAVDRRRLLMITQTTMALSSVQIMSRYRMAPPWLVARPYDERANAGWTTIAAPGSEPGRCLT